MVPWIILIIILLGGGAAGYFFKDELKEYLFTGVHDDEGEEHGEAGDNKHGEDENEGEGAESELDGDTDDSSEEGNGENGMSENDGLEEVTDDSADEAEEAVLEEEPEPVKEEVVTINTSSPGGNYHIIGNAFKEKPNAESYVSQMSNKGYSASIIGRFDGLYLVTLKSYSSMSDAKSGLSGVSEEGAWVFKWPK